MRKILRYFQKLFLLILLLCAGLGAGLLAPSQARAGETITYIHADIAGSPIAATNAAGNLLWKESYRPYGARSQNTDQGKHAQWFTGKSLEASTGLSYFGARYYDPVVGRFMGIDPVGFMENNLHSFNRYAYGNNNPSRYLDPDGNLPILIPLAAAYVFGNAAIGAGFDYAFQKALGHTVNWGQVAFGGFAGGMLGGAGGVGASAVMNSTKATTSVVKSASPVAKTVISGEKLAISTGRTEAKTLLEELAMQEVKANPAGYTPRRMPPMSDTKNGLLAENGWIKRSQNVNGVEIHYVENINTGQVIDFKFAQ
jgi:RHS repeat-associated protein